MDIAAKTDGDATQKNGSNPSLALILFRTLFLFTFTVVVIVAASLIAVSFATYETEARSNLVQEAENAAAILNNASQEERLSILNQQTVDSVRFTLVAPDGEVLFESNVVPGAQGNHANRPEVKAAVKNGASSVARFSDTLQTDTIYAAARLDDGSVIRLSETRGSLFAFVSPMAAPLLVALMLIAVLLALISRALTRKIMAPLQRIDIMSPAPERSYAEIIPAIDKINKQQRLLKEQNEKLQKAEQVRRDFSANVSHEMKTPLHVISGYAEIMAAGNVPHEKVKDFALLIYDEAQDMRRLIDDVLVLSRLDEPIVGHKQMVTLDIMDIASEAAVKLKPLADKQGISIDVRGESAVIKGDHALLDQMTTNLISNAIHYNKPAGKVDVVVTPCDSSVILQVSDTGIGIPEQDREKIFERFYRVDKSRSRETGGTGLGLAIAKHAAIFHGGTITVQSIMGEGSTFEVRIPIKPRH